MADRPPEAPSSTDAKAAISRLERIGTGLRGCVVLDADGAALAASGDLERWGAAGAELLEAADAAASEPATQVHVATEDGEVLAVRERGVALVAVAERFTLASLAMFDMRAALHQLLGPRRPASMAPAPTGQG